MDATVRLQVGSSADPPASANAPHVLTDRCPAVTVMAMETHGDIIGADKLRTIGQLSNSLMPPTRDEIDYAAVIGERATIRYAYHNQSWPDALENAASSAPIPASLATRGMSNLSPAEIEFIYQVILYPSDVAAMREFALEYTE